MSLFPAYSDVENEQNCDINKQCSINKNSKWLENSSYEIVSACLHSSANNANWTDSSDEDSNDIPNATNKNETVSETLSDVTKTKLIKTKNKNKNIKSSSIPYVTDLKNVYFQDKQKDRRFYTIETLEHAVRPNYKLSKYKLGYYSKKLTKRDNFQRYHVKNLDASKKLVKKDIVKSDDEKQAIITNTVEQIKQHKLLDEQKLMIEEFNVKLAKNPENIDTWLEYVSFQDKITLTSPFYSEKETLKQLTIKKKLFIIEKGLAANHNSVELLKMKLSLMSQLVPADEFSDQIEAMIQKDPKNIILWQTLIMLTQKSCALCKVSKILNLYIKGFPVLKQKSKVDPKFYDEQILGLLYHCLIFLRHGGLWEQMWEIIRINLCLNLALQHTDLKNIQTIDEKVLMKMEEVILNSKLPLNQLWLRIESLRESSYWISVDIKNVDINLIADEKRLVSTEETIDFVYPTISKESNFRLIILSILCLKVPLLPSRHCILKDFRLDDDIWTIDSLELILPMIYPTIWIGDVDERLNNKIVITDLLDGKLISGPQFLKFHPAQEQFVDFIRLVFNTVAEKLPALQRTSIFIWWLRFERLLVFIGKNDPLRDPKQNKKIKSIIKNFLKKPENRNNLHFYREFALIEYELGFYDSSIQILKTIIQSRETNYLNTDEKSAYFSLYRTIFEILLNQNNYKDKNFEIFQEITRNLENYMSSCFNYDQCITVEEMMYNEILNFLSNSVIDELEDAFLLPNINCDILICYAYLLQSKGNINDNIDDILDLFDKCLIHCNKCVHLQERFYETKIAFLQFCQLKFSNVKSTLTKTANEALDQFPCNFFLLSVNALNESELPLWKLKIPSRKSNVWSIFAHCLAGRARITYLNNIDSEDALKAMINKMLSFHKIISKTQNLQNCPLVWRFYMLLLREHNLCQKKGEDIYYEAVAQCPWARSVYISAAEIAPQILSQIQDLLTEKELRMYVTSEELNILRE